MLSTSRTSYETNSYAARSTEVVVNLPPPSSESTTSSLSWEMRIQCFIGCFVLSVVSSLCGSYLLLLTKLRGFCILTSLGAVFSLSSTCFLMGPIGQLKKMFDKSRWIASALYIAMIACTLIAGLVLENAPLALVFTILQYVAMTWYSLSYIPYAREALSKIICSCL